MTIYGQENSGQHDNRLPRLGIFQLLILLYMMFHTLVGPICNFARIVQKTVSIQQNERSMRKTTNKSPFSTTTNCYYEITKGRPSWKHDV